MKKSSVVVNKNIENYVKSFFENVHYSKEVEKVKESIIKKVNNEYRLEEAKDKRTAFSNIVKKYNTLESLAQSINYDVTKIDKWFNKEVTTTYEDFELEFKKEKKYIYLITILSIVSVMYFITIFMQARDIKYLYVVPIFFILVDIIAIIKHRLSEKREVISVDSGKKLENLFDRYSKRCLIWIFIFFISIFFITFDLINLSFNSRTFEVVSRLDKQLYLIGSIVFFLTKNILIIKWLNKKIDFENEDKFKKVFKKVIRFSIIYYIISTILYYLFERFIVFSIMWPVIILYLIYVWYEYFINSKKYKYDKKGINKLILIPLILGIIGFCGYSFLSRDIWLVQPIINSTPYIYEGNDFITYDDYSGVYTIVSNEDDFKILQITDVHLGGGIISYDKDIKALKAVYKLIEYTKPDLVIVTGDLTFPVGIMSFSFNNTAPVEQFAAFMRNTGVPWAFTYGNHDTESMAIGSKSELNDLYKSLSWKTSRNLLYPYTQPILNGEKITGRNNQLIEIRNSDGTLNQALFLIDSNAYSGKGFNKYDYIRDDQVEWYEKEILRLNEEEGRIIPSLVFFHIPLQEYKEAYNLYKEGSSEVKYYFGDIDAKISPGNHPSELFDTAVRLQSSKAFFCGHDHYNNISLEYKGILLTYGMSIDYLAMPGIARKSKQRGATLITSHKDSSIDIEQIPLNKIK